MEPGILYIDSRVGSRELAPIFQRRHGAKVSLTTLTSADVAWCCGHTVKNPFCEGDYGCKVGVERKTPSDLIGSLLKSRLDGRQVPLMLRGYVMSYILIEGRYRRARQTPQIETATWSTEKPPKEGGDGSVEIVKWTPSKCGLTYPQLESWLARYEAGAYGHIQVIRNVASMDHTTDLIQAKASWWWKDWNKHHFGAITKMEAPVKAMLFTANEYQKIIASLPGVGMVNMKKVYGYFTSIYGMMAASPREWVKAGLGKKRAMEMYHMLRREWR